MTAQRSCFERIRTSVLVAIVFGAAQIFLSPAAAQTKSAQDAALKALMRNSLCCSLDSKSGPREA